MGVLPALRAAIPHLLPDSTASGESIFEDRDADLAQARCPDELLSRIQLECGGKLPSPLVDAVQLGRKVYPP